VHRQVGLLVAFDAERQDGARALDRALADPGHHAPAVDRDRARAGDVEAREPS
jgi:hypothetical protein